MQQFFKTVFGCIIAAGLVAFWLMAIGFVIKASWLFISIGWGLL